MGGRKVKMPKKNAFAFYKYMVDLPDENEEMQTYIIRSRTPLFEEKEPGEKKLTGDELSKEILSRNVLNISLVELNVKSVYLSKAIKFEGKIVDEENVGMSEARFILNDGMKGNPSITLRCEGEDFVPKKKFKIISSRMGENPFTKAREA